MIQKGVTSKLSNKILAYRMVGGIIGNILSALFLSGFVLLPAYFITRSFLYVYPVFFIALAIVYISIYLGWKFYEYMITDTNITIRSGVFFRSAKTANFNDLQNVQVSYGPVSMIFGVKIVTAYSASPAQVQTIT